MATLWDRAKLGKGPARSTALSASRAGARSHNGPLQQGHDNPVGPGEAREGACQDDRVARFPSWRPVPQRPDATGPWQPCGTGRSSGRGLPDRPRCPLPELAPGPTTARCNRAMATLWDRAKLGKGPARTTALPASRAGARSHNGPRALQQRGKVRYKSRWYLSRDGRVNTNAVCPARPWHWFRVPSWASRIERQIASPMPMPVGLVVKNALKMLS